MEHASVEAIIDRLKKATGTTTDIELSKKLGLSKQSIAAARAKGEIPASWIPKAAKLFHVSMDWLYWGQMRRHYPLWRTKLGLKDALRQRYYRSDDERRKT